MITKEQAMKAAHGEELYSMRRAHKEPGADGTVEPRRAAVSGRCRTWRSHPEAFRLPIKLSHFRVAEVTERTAGDWTFDKREAMQALNPLHDKGSQ